MKLLAIYLVPMMLCGCASAEGSPQKSDATVIEALSSWKTKNWVNMYECLSSKDKELTTLEEFSEKRQFLSESRTLTDFVVGEPVLVDEHTVKVKVKLLMSENVNARFQFNLDEQLVEVDATWTLVREGDRFYLTFLDR